MSDIAVTVLSVVSVIGLLWLVTTHMEKRNKSSSLAYSHCLAAKELLHALDYEGRETARASGSLFIPYKTTDYDCNLYRISSLGHDHNNEKLIGIYSKIDDMWLMISSEVLQFEPSSLIHREKYYLCDPGFAMPSPLAAPYNRHSEKKLIEFARV